MGEVFISGKGVVEICDNVMAGECTVLPSYMVVCYVVVDTFGNMTTNIHDFMVDVILSGACHGYLVSYPSEQFSAVQHVEMITILFLLQLAQALPHFTNTIGCKF